MRILWLLIIATAAFSSGAGPANPTDEDEGRRKQAIADFTARTKAAHYPSLFDQAAKEFNVPSDVLKGIAFAETRWEHLTWPPGETVSPETGMPRPYGIMSLWDNQYFGHGLLDAAALIGKTPDELKADPLLNIRGAAALLKKIYDENPRPKETTDADIESWRYAIRKYCGIPEPDLNARHALDVYTFMSQGYHDFGIEWNARPVNLDPMRRETAQIIAEEDAKRAAKQQVSGSNAGNTLTNLSTQKAASADVATRPRNAAPETKGKTKVNANDEQEKPNHSGWIMGLIFGIMGIGILVLLRNARRNQ
jgi:hypothetical protein